MKGEPHPLANQFGVVVFTGDDEVSRCTGTLVNLNGRTVVISAAHCFRDDPPGSHYRVSRNVVRGNANVVAEELGTLHSVKLHPKYLFKGKDQSNPYDLAVGEISTLKRIRLLGMDLAEAGWQVPVPGDSREFLISGGGAQDVNYRDDVSVPVVLAGQYRSEIRIERGSTWGAIRDVIAPAGLAEGDLLSMSARDPQDPYVCLGDSGGGLIEWGGAEGRLVGVLSTASRKQISGRWECWWYPFIAVPISVHLNWLNSL